jgi:hypothetical protein
MLGLVISLAAVLSAPAPPALAAQQAPAPLVADAVACGEGPASCDLGQAAGPAFPRPVDYATPAVIDCRSDISPILPIVQFVLAGLVECEGPHDASYRVSRYPESENTESLSPGAPQARGRVASCDGLPQKEPSLPLSDAQPLALFATPTLIHASTAIREGREIWKIPSRFGDPPDRPPRV